MGLCEEHYNEKELERARRDSAVNALHYSKVDNEYFQNKAIRDELFKIQKWWLRGCNALNSGFEDEILKNEADASTSWCISLAKELVDAERRHRNGGGVSNYMLESTREWVWERFRNLEAGLMSNGVNRPIK
jgi:hypothetical protein